MHLEVVIELVSRYARTPVGQTGSEILLEVTINLLVYELGGHELKCLKMHMEAMMKRL